MKNKTILLQTLLRISANNILLPLKLSALIPVVYSSKYPWYLRCFSQVKYTDKCSHLNVYNAGNYGIYKYNKYIKSIDVKTKLTTITNNIPVCIKIHLYKIPDG